ncbi:MAG: hypothetical protein LUD17_03495 [Bacteroidales bacterium]|nr:hypothetical protein [Bacteroidales bacterium]
MTESKGNDESHIIDVNIANGVDRCAVYKYELDEKDFLPFFNDKQAGAFPRLKRLRGFCDYIVLVESNDNLSILLIEMKRGNSDDAEDQLAAGRVFMEYIVSSANRIKDINGYSDFDCNAIQYRLISLKRPKSNKTTTRPKDLSDLDKNQIMHISCPGRFYLNRIL